MAVLRLGEAIDRVLGLVRPLPAEPVPLEAALGRTLAEDVLAGRDVPGHDNAAMDGFAVRSADLEGASAERPVELRVIGEVAAGGRFEGALGPGEAVRIMTGAPIPPGADQVIEQERTAWREEGRSVLVPMSRGPGKQIRRAGEDLARGRVALARGERLGPAEIGLLASLGVTRPRCGRRPRVAILSTGDEVVPPAEEPRPGEVRDSNAASLFAAALEAGAEPLGLGIARDEPAAIAGRLGGEAAGGADLVLTSAGISRSGSRDHVAEAVASLGWREVFREVAIKPGRPTALYEREGRLLFGLPGNPVAALVSFLLFVRPALLALEGRSAPRLPEVFVPAPEDHEERRGRVNLLRARLAPEPLGGYRVAEVLPEGSGILRSMHVANALLCLEGRLRARDPILALILKEVL